MSKATAEQPTVSDLVEAERRFQLVMDHAPVGMSVVAPDGHFELVNPAMCAFLGRSHDDLMGRTWQDLTHPDDLAADVELLDEIVDGKRDDYRMRKRYIRPDGTVVWGDLSVAAVRNEAHGVAYLISQVSDVTALVSAEHDLVETRNDAQADRARLHATLESLVDPHVVLGPVHDEARRIIDFEVLETNRAARAAADGSVVVAVGTRLGQLQAADPTWQLLFVCSDAMTSGRNVVVDRLPILGERPEDDRWFDIRAALADGCVACTWRDVTDRVTADSRIHRSEARLRAVIDVAPVAMAVLDTEYRIVEANPSLCELLHADRDWLIGRHVEDLDAVGDGSMLRRSSAAPLEIRLRGAAGHDAWVEYSVVPIAGGEPRTYVAQFVDVRQARRRREVLQHEATHDPMTGLVNRRELDHLLATVLAHPPRGGGALGILAIDVDNLKPINDAFGHPVGDQLLIETAERLRHGARVDDVIARVGGDEFMVVLPSTASLETTVGVARSLLQAFTEPMELGGTLQPVTVSIGVTVAAPGEDADAVFARVDAALLEAKAAGRAQLVAVAAPTNN